MTVMFIKISHNSKLYTLNNVHVCRGFLSYSCMLSFVFGNLAPKIQV